MEYANNEIFFDRSYPLKLSFSSKGNFKIEEKDEKFVFSHFFSFLNSEGFGETILEFEVFFILKHDKLSPAFCVIEQRELFYQKGIEDLGDLHAFIEKNVNNFVESYLNPSINEILEFSISEIDSLDEFKELRLSSVVGSFSNPSKDFTISIPALELFKTDAETKFTTITILIYKEEGIYHLELFSNKNIISENIRFSFKTNNQSRIDLFKIANSKYHKLKILFDPKYAEIKEFLKIK